MWKPLTRAFKSWLMLCTALHDHTFLLHPWERLGWGLEGLCPIASHRGYFTHHCTRCILRLGLTLQCHYGDALSLNDHFTWDLNSWEKKRTLQELWWMCWGTVSTWNGRCAGYFMWIALNALCQWRSAQVATVLSPCGLWAGNYGYSERGKWQLTYGGGLKHMVCASAQLCNINRLARWTIYECHHADLCRFPKHATEEVFLCYNNDVH